MDQLSKMLDWFNNAYTFQINHTKSIAFWIGGKKEILSTWTYEFKWTWAPHEAISKLLGTPFELSLSLANVDRLDC